MIKHRSRNNVVLAVDDSTEILGFLSQALGNADMTTLVALDGTQAINIAQKLLPDIILLDALMPNMDGFDTCKKLKSISSLKDIPVIFMTGLSDTESVVKGFNAGGADYLSKPIHPQELVVRINTHVMQSRSMQSAKNVLDDTGQNVFSISFQGERIWSTPEADKIFDKMHQENLHNQLHSTLLEWIDRKPNIGNKFHFTQASEPLTAIYLGEYDGEEHLVRLITDSRLDEKSHLVSHFPITPREADVFLWLAKGKTNREIAQILEMSPRTVNKHLEQLFKKLSVDNRTSAAGLALESLQKIRLT